MPRRARSLAFAAAATMSFAFVWVSDAAEVHIKGYLQESIAGRKHDLDDLLFHRQTFNVEASVEATRDLRFELEVDLWRDDPDFLGRDTYRSRVREAHAKLRFDAFDLRVGRFQVAWGQSDAVVVSDQVTPFDFTNFITPEFDEIRIGVDGAMVDYYFDSGNELQVVWLTRFTSPDFPDLDSPWSPFDAEAAQAAGLAIQERVEPPWTLGNSEYGLRYTGHPGAFDWSVGYFRSFDDRPALRVRPPNVVPTHDRYHLVMADLAWPLGNYLWRVDTAFEDGRLLSTLNPDDPFDPRSQDTAAAGFVAAHELWRTLVAVETKPDIAWWHQADLAVQFVHEEVLDPHPTLSQAAQTDYLVVIASAAYRNETIKPRVLGIANLRGDDAWLQARMDYEPIDNWRFSLEYDQFFGHAFDGNDGGTFGLFNANDLFQATVRYSY